MNTQGQPLLQSRLDVHDRKQFEVKLEYQPTGHDAKTRYLVEAYFFLPASLNIDGETYPRQDFYADIHNYVRLKTPVMTLRELLEGEASPLSRMARLVQASPLSQTQVIYEAKLVSCVFRGALRRFASRVEEHCDATERKEDCAEELQPLESFSRESLELVKLVMLRYRELAKAVFVHRLEEKTLASLRLVDEYMSLSIEQFLRKAVADMDKLARTPQNLELRKALMGEVLAEEAHRKEHKLRSVLSPTGDNEEYMHRMGFLKKFCMNILFLNARKEQRKTHTEEILFAIAAGLAMTFATAVAFWGQQRFPQVSLNFFLILVVGYMMKDRIKDGLRRIFAHAMARRLYDRTITISDPVTKRRVGVCKEKIDFGPFKVPDDVNGLRRHDDFVTVSQGELAETSMRYQKQIVLASELLPHVAGRSTGVTDIIRFNIERLLRDMDDPEYALEYVDLEDYSVGRVRGAKSYQVDVAFRFSAEDADLKKTDVHMIRLVLDRNGIKRMVRLDADAAVHTPPPHRSEAA